MKVLLKEVAYSVREVLGWVPKIRGPHSGYYDSDLEVRRWFSAVGILLALTLAWAWLTG